MTPAEKQARIDAIAELREEKSWSYRRIAEKLCISEGYVSWLCLINGIEKPGPRRPVGPVGAGSFETRNGHMIRRFSDEEDQRLLALEASGASYAEMARTLGRARNSVIGRLATLARRDARAESC